MNRMLSPKPMLFESGMPLLRILVGLFLMYHGWELFTSSKMEEYAGWDVFKKTPFPLALVYLGKGLELIGGLLLVLGLFTRLACIAIIITMLFIAFIIGSGKFWYEDQYPVLFALLAVVFFFYGPGKWSLDAKYFGSK